MNYINGDVFDALNTPYTMLIHGCNAQGVMGSGVAKTFKERFPEAFQKYGDDLKNQVVGLGTTSFYNLGLKQSDNVVASGITQRYYGRDGKQYVDYSAVQSVFLECIAVAKYRLQMIAMPKIGAGLGGGDWGIISDILQKSAHYLKYPESLIYIYEI